ncbi:hypothetical protein IFM12275_41130 [Nocardia sputorum]|uniref:hypothetical protein n=1 Tax=Nocardia TaxID=1817 RepID=UPI0024551BD0|nr:MULTISPECIES: hypothetical protein [Nocardia]BDT94137.1 hypothetical protein IFM12275_41130 [Nocardia sputorum]
MTEPTLEVLQQSSTTGLTAAQQVQRLYDDVGWQIENPSWAKLRHILLHLTKINAEIGALIEPIEHAEHHGETPSEAEFLKKLREESHIVGDLIFHAAQIANMAGVKLADEFNALHRRNARRFAPDSEFASQPL